MARSLSKEHIDAYKKGGVFEKLYFVITEDPELSFEIRLSDEVKVYFRKKLILTTTIKNGRPEVMILNESYYKNKTKPSVDLSDINNIKRKDLIKKYFAEAKMLLYQYNVGLEFEIQQKIALGNHSFNGKYLVVDMEWRFAQGSIDNDHRLKNNTAIDLVIVDTKVNAAGYNDIYLAEVKVSLGAAEGKSGIIDHVEKTNAIICNEMARKALKEDVKTIISEKEQLGLITGEHIDFHFADKPKMMLILGYRSAEEKASLREYAQKAKSDAKARGMASPVCMMYNTLINLEGLESV